MKKKQLSLIVALILVLSVLPMSAMAEAAQNALNSARTEAIERADWDGAERRFYVVTFSFTVAPDAPSALWGDADGDGVVTAADALLLTRYILDSNSAAFNNLEWCDVNGDGEIDLIDALLIVRHAIGAIEIFPVEE